MEVAPTPLDLQEFQFKLHCKFKVLSKIELNQLKRNPNLISAASLYGLVFIGCHKELQVLKLSDIIKNESKSEINSYVHRSINLSYIISHVSVNSDCSLLAVVVEKDNCSVAIIYSINNFLSQNVPIFNEIRLSSTPNVYVLDICWNPSICSMLAVCMSDGSVGVYELTPNEIKLNTLPPMSQSRCLCWSPKGKQIVIGAVNGTLTQYKPDLKNVKTYPAPPLNNNSNNVTITNVLWISNYQFIGVFKEGQSFENNSSMPSLIIVNTPKNGPVTYINYEDICYSGSSLRPHKFYFIYQPTWNIVLTASANSMELGVMGGNGIEWQQWIQSDEARAELPLSASKEETYPVGLALDTGAVHQLPWGDNKTLPPMPVLYLLSHEGVLNVFNVINIRSDATNICSPPQLIPDQTGGAFKNQVSIKTNIIPTETAVTIQPTIEINKPLVPQSPAFSQQQQLQQQPLQQQQLPQKSAFSFQGFTSTPIANPEKSNLFNVKSMSVQNPVNFSTSQPIAIQKSSTSIAPATSNRQLSKNSPIEIKQNEIIISKQSDDNTTVNNSVIQSLIVAEIKTFESEIENLLTRCKLVNTNVGSDSEKNDLVEKCEDLKKFFTALSDNTEAQTAEVHQLKQQLIEAYALQEEAHSRFKRLSNPNFVDFFKVNEIDQVSNKKIQNMKSLLYYVETQLIQVNQKLDENWNNFQDKYKKNSKDIYLTPTMEAVYQSMIKQNEIVKQQQFLLKDLKARIKNYNKKQVKVPLLSNVPDSNQLVNEMKNLHVDTTDVILNKIANTQNKFNTLKEDKLRAMLITHKVTRITPNKLSVSSRLSAGSLSQKLSAIKVLEPKKESIKIIDSMPVVETTPVAVTKLINDEFKPKSAAYRKLFEDVSRPTVEITPESSTKPTLFPTFNSEPFKQSTNFETSKPSTFQFQKSITETAFLPTTSSSAVNKPIKTFETITNTTSVPIIFSSANKSTDVKTEKIVPSLASTKPIGSAFNFSPTFSFSSTPQTTTNNSDNKLSSTSTTTSLFSGTKPSAFGGFTLNTNTTAFKFDDKKDSSPTIFSKTTDVSKTTSAFSFTASNIKKNVSFGTTILTVPSSTISFVSKTISSTVNDNKTTITPSPSSPSVSILPVVASQKTNSNVTEEQSIDVVPIAISFDSAKGAVATVVTTSTVTVTQVETQVTSNTTTPEKVISTSDSVVTTTSTNIFTAASTSASSISFSTVPSTTTSIFSSVPTAVTSTATVTTASIFGAVPSIQSQASPLTFGEIKSTIVSTASTPISTQQSIFGGGNISPLIGTSINAFVGISTASSNTVPVQSATTTTTTIVQQTPSSQTTNNTFSFGNLSVANNTQTTTANATSTSPFSFGNLNISALSPQTTNNAATSATTASTFSFINPSSTIAQTSNKDINSFSFRPSIFQTPTTNTAVTTAQNVFMGSQICSPSSFSTPTNQQTVGSIFGGSSNTQPSSTGGNIFSQAAKTATASIFGPKTGGTSTTPTKSIFGNTTPNTNANQAPNNAGSIFAKSNTSSMFGQSGGSIFGGAPSFGGAPAFGQPATFGNAAAATPPQSTNIFGSAATTTAFGANPNANIFGGGAAQSTNAFGSPNNQSQTGGSFNSPNQSINQTGFGSSPAFGVAKPAFGSPPTFGGSPGGFGSTPSFGTSPSFGSQPKVFGSTIPQTTSPTFGTVQQNATFANLATQNTVGFGNLAQQSSVGSQMPQAPQFTSSNAFNTWR